MCIKTWTVLGKRTFNAYKKAGWLTGGTCGILVKCKVYGKWSFKHCETVVLKINIWRNFGSTEMNMHSEDGYNDTVSLNGQISGFWIVSNQFYHFGLRYFK